MHMANSWLVRRSVPRSSDWLEGREHELTVLRWQYTPEAWTDLLMRHGFTDIQALVLEAPEPDKLGTLLVRAHTSA
jgi:precorrin-6B methylase 1